jgi:hypothetical protein
MLNIEPIKLLSGSHADTAQTGSGCFMNVIAYLNGEPQITDESPCVCRAIRRPAIWINDFLNDSERHLLLQFVQRAMGTATDDEKVLRQRIRLLIEYIRDVAGLAHDFAPDSDASRSAASSRLLAEMAAKHSRIYWTQADYFGELATDAASAAGDASKNAVERKALVERTLAYLESVCPAADAPSRALIERANRLLELAVAQGDD